jgi:hypothetical protein
MPVRPYAAAVAVVVAVVTVVIAVVVLAGGCDVLDDVTCFQPGTGGDVCDGDLFCAVGFRCLPAGDINTCQPRVDVDGACLDDGDCLENLACADGPPDGKCRPRAQEGEACPDSVCVAGFTCMSKPLGTPEACHPLPVEDEPCPTGLCAPELACVLDTFDRLCKPAPHVGESCEVTCASDSVCDQSDPSICQPRAKKGEDCFHLTDESCEDGLYCSTTSITCRARPDLCE